MIPVRNFVKSALVRVTAARPMVTVTSPVSTKKDELLPPEVPTHTGQVNSVTHKPQKYWLVLVTSRFWIEG